jgi:serine/threonine protein kinase
MSGRPARVIPFGKYLLLERIAVGGMAEVYMAKSFGVEGFEKVLAIKRILPTMAEDDDFIDMFIDEAKIAGQLTHGNIAPIYELGKIGDSHYIAMEYVWGKDLLQIMNRFRRMRKRMPAVMVAWIASKMCEALDFAHHKKNPQGNDLHIIHRDVSPQNVLVSYEGEVKLIDFGIAKAASRTTRTQAGVLKGKFGYMSPEQVRGLAVDARSDLFAVGTCMYEMLTSERLFMGESDFSTLEKVRNAEIPPVREVVRDIPPALDEVVMRALQREASDRWQSAGELQEALQRFLTAQRPPFGTSKLAAWLKSAFATEMAREKDRMDSFSKVGLPSVLATGRKKPVDDAFPQVPQLDDEDLHGEATLLSASPFEESEENEGAEEPTQIFFSAEDAEAMVGYSEPVATFRPSSSRPAPYASSTGPSSGTAPPPVSPSGLGSIPPAGPPGAWYPPPPGPHHDSRQLHAGAAYGGGVASLPAEVGHDEMGRASDARLIALFGVAAVAMLGLGVALAFLLFGPDPVGTIEILTVPTTGANVTIDGVPRGRAPLRVQRIPAGERVIEVRAEGFHSELRRVTVGESSVSRLEIALRELPSVAVGVNMAGVDTTAERLPSDDAERAFVVQETEREVERAAADEAAAAREAEREAQRQQAEEREREARLRAERRLAEARRAEERAAERDQSSAMAVGPTELPTMGTVSTGTIRVNTIPWSQVFIDGRDTGRRTPIMSLRIAAGTHRIGLRTADGTMHSVTVDVGAGETVTINRAL